MKKIILLIFLFTYPLQSQTTFKSNPTISQLNYFNSNLNNLTDENGVNIIQDNSYSTGSIIFNGESTGDNFGYSVANAGDVNGDGFDDVIIGARNYDSARGRAYIFLGDISPDLVADVIISGEFVGNKFGSSVSTAGDVNGDGFDDVIIGAPNLGAGKVYIYYGNISIDTIADKVLERIDMPFFGSMVGTVGDVNGDGFDDIFIGSFNFAALYTQWIYYGGVDMDDVYDFDMQYGIGPPLNTVSSSASLAGDINGDGFNDILKRNSNATSTIYLGGVVLNENNKINFPYYNGSSLSNAGDVNNDGFSDIIIGAHLSDNEKGRAYIFFGGTNMDTVPDVILYGENVSDKFGWSVSSAGDLNGDGFDDLIVGAVGYDSSKGKVYVYYGGTNMDSIPEFTKVGENANDNFGNSISSAGDINGDGFDEIIVGAYNFNQGTGRSYIFSNLVLFGPDLVYPINHSINNFNKINFRWRKSSTAIDYILKISTDSVFSNIVSIDSTLLDTSKIVNGLKRNTKYYWKVGAISNTGFVSNSAVYDFTTIPPIYLDLKLLMEGLYFPPFDKLLRNDSVIVYIRNATSPFALIDSAINIIDSNNYTGSFNFQNATTGTYYIVIKHFNSIETWSKTGGELLFSDGYTYNYDFTNSITKAFGNNLKLKGSKYCLFSGDVNQDGFINLSDLIPIKNDASSFLSGRYIVTDLTGDNIVDLTDVSLCYNNATNFVTVIKP